MVKIVKMNQLFEKHNVNALMAEDCVIVNCGRIFKDTVISVVNTLKAEGIKTGEVYWNDGINAYIIPLI